jgi:hypothetical protein
MTPRTRTLWRNGTSTGAVCLLLAAFVAALWYGATYHAFPRHGSHGGALVRPRLRNRERTAELGAGHRGTTGWDQGLPSARKKSIMRESDGRRSLIKNPCTYGRIASAATATAEAGT